MITKYSIKALCLSVMNKKKNTAFKMKNLEIWYAFYLFNQIYNKIGDQKPMSVSFSLELKIKLFTSFSNLNYNVISNLTLIWLFSSTFKYSFQSEFLFLFLFSFLFSVLTFFQFLFLILHSNISFQFIF